MLKKRYDPICAYCGKKASETSHMVTKEHVVPKTLFERGPDIQLEYPLLTVPVCAQCNNEKSKDDDDLRDYLAVRLRHMGHHGVGHLVSGFVGSARYGSSTLARRFITEGRIVRHSPTGLLLPYLIGVKIDNTQLLRSVKSIARGLYYKETQKIKAPRVLNPDYVYEFSELSGDQINACLFAFVNIGASPRALGNCEFEYQIKRFPQEPDTTMWTFCFFGAIFYIGLTYPADVQSGTEHIRKLMIELIEGSPDNAIATDGVSTTV